MDVAVRDINRDLNQDLNQDLVSFTEESDGTPSPAQASSPADVLAALGARVAPTSMARERILPTADVFADLFPEGGLVRGRVLSCTGAAATSLALGVLAPAVVAGAWVAVIDVPTLGLDAASELGMPLERVVAVDTRFSMIDRTANVAEGAAVGRGAVAGAERSGAEEAGSDAAEAAEAAARRWADVVAAAADGFDVMIVRVPVGLRSGTVRKVATRIQQRGVVLVVLGSPGPFVCDGVLESAGQVWSGLGAGWGHLHRRSVEVAATGRRLPGRRTRTLDLPAITPGTPGTPDTGTDPLGERTEQSHLPQVVAAGLSVAS